MNFNSLITKGLSSLYQWLITKGFPLEEVPVPTPARRHGGTVISLESKLRLKIQGQKLFEEQVTYSLFAVIQKRVKIYTIASGAKSFNSSLESKLHGSKEFITETLLKIKAETGHLIGQILKIKGNTKHLSSYNTRLSGKKSFDINTAYLTSANRQYSTKINKIISASRASNSKLIYAAKGTRDLFPILFAAVDMYNDIFTNELEV
jgi:hypothetical protein